MKVRRVSLEQLLKQLENSRMSSDLGKDILSTYDILRGCPFDRNEAASRIILNNAKHPDILASLSKGSRQNPKPAQPAVSGALPGSSECPWLCTGGSMKPKLRVTTICATDRISSRSLAMPIDISSG